MHTARFKLPGAFPRDEVLSSQTTDTVPAELSLEWQAISREYCNVLVEAMPADAGQILEWLRPHLRNPIEEYRPQSGVPVPEPAEGTLILSGVERLDAGQQAQVLRWLDRGRCRVQLASISSKPLFPLVEAGSFDASLYYRLNIVRIEWVEPT
jgi:transcriptional regulator of acetoin/glycerol metabolism